MAVMRQRRQQQGLYAMSLPPEIERRQIEAAHDSCTLGRRRETRQQGVQPHGDERRKVHEEPGLPEQPAAHSQRQPHDDRHV